MRYEVMSSVLDSYPAKGVEGIGIRHGVEREETHDNSKAANGFSVFRGSLGA
jgi:hypothetical protein